MELDYTPEFKRAVRKLSRRYRSIQSDLEPLFEELKTGKTPGDPLQNVNYTAFKVRVQNSDSRKGKSGGYRVIYYLKKADKTVLVTMYSKSLQQDISPHDVQRIVAKYDATTDT